MTDISQDEAELQHDPCSVLYVLMALGGFWVMVGAIAWMVL
jgi:hypothetical protein